MGVLAALGVAVAPAVSSAPMVPTAATAPNPSSAQPGDATATGPERAGWLGAAGRLGAPAPALRAHRFAETVVQRADPTCNLDWSLLAAIGDVESNHGRHGDSVLRSDGTSTPHILGPRLDGFGSVAALTDTDNGRLDGDARWDRAVGPMQFIPATWTLVGSDADGDGLRNVHDLDDAALAAAVYLCAGNADLSTASDRRAAVYRYNPSWSYVDLVLRLAAAYAGEGVRLQPAVPADVAGANLPALSHAVQRAAHPPRSSAGTLGRRRDRQGGAPVDDAGDAASVRDPGRHTSVDDTHVAVAARSTSSAGRRDTADANERVLVRRSRSVNDGGAATKRSGAGDGGDTVEGGDSSSDGGTADGDNNTRDGAGTTDGDSTSSGDGTADEDTASGDGGTSDDGDGSADGGQEEEPATEISGVLDRAEDDTWSVGGQAVDFGDSAYLDSQALNDFDGEDGVESNIGELETLLGHEVRVVLDEGTDVVRELNGLTYR